MSSKSRSTKGRVALFSAAEIKVEAHFANDWKAWRGGKGGKKERRIGGRVGRREGWGEGKGGRDGREEAGGQRGRECQRKEGRADFM